MKALLWSRTTLIWLLLVAATLLSWKMRHEVGILDVRLAGVAIIAVTFIKVRLVIFDFMEIRSAPAWMRWIGDGWVALIAGLLIARFLIPG